MRPEKLDELEQLFKTTDERFARRQAAAMWPTRLFAFPKEMRLPRYTPEELDSMSPAEFKRLEEKYPDPEMDAWWESLTDEELKEQIEDHARFMEERAKARAQNHSLRTVWGNSRRI